MRVEFVHEGDPGDDQWKMAAYESPVGERLWHATATATVPLQIICALLDSLGSGDATKIAAGSPVSEETISEATRPLADAGWEHTIDGRRIRWQAPGGRHVGVQFDAFAAQAHPCTQAAWTFWGGNVGSPKWALRFSPHAAASVLQSVVFEVANGRTPTPITAHARHHDVIDRASTHTSPAPRVSSARRG